MDVMATTMGVQSVPDGNVLQMPSGDSGADILFQLFSFIGADMEQPTSAVLPGFLDSEGQVDNTELKKGDEAKGAEENGAVALLAWINSGEVLPTDIKMQDGAKEEMNPVLASASDPVDPTIQMDALLKGVNQNVDAPEVKLRDEKMAAILKEIYTEMYIETRARLSEGEPISQTGGDMQVTDVQPDSEPKPGHAVDNNDFVVPNKTENVKNDIFPFHLVVDAQLHVNADQSHQGISQVVSQKEAPVRAGEELNRLSSDIRQWADVNYATDSNMQVSIHTKEWGTLQVSIQQTEEGTKVELAGEKHKELLHIADHLQEDWKDTSIEVHVKEENDGENKERPPKRRSELYRNQDSETENIFDWNQEEEV